jgi:ribosomal-protein-alanine acetyltransferase
MIDNYMPQLRRGETEDLESIRAIQAASPQAAQWDAAQYPDFDLFVAAAGQGISGFVVGRKLASDEYEILNLAVAPESRRQGIARALVSMCLAGFRGTVYLEVRPSNLPARQLYRSLGFEESTVRPDYYQNPSEAAIVMKFHSC